MSKIKFKDLKNFTNELNVLTGNLTVPFPAGANYKKNAGRFYVSNFYGLQRLNQTKADGTGKDVFEVDFIPSRQLYHLIKAYMGGIRYAFEHGQPPTKIIINNK